MNPRIAIYPGSFDPVTNGHLDIIQRGASLADRLIVSVASTTGGKKPMFTVAERLTLLGAEIAALQEGGVLGGRVEGGVLGGRVEVAAFDGLLIDYAQSVQAKMIVRGLRAMTDFDYEFQMTGMNRRLNADIETVFLMASERNQFISSRMVKEVAVLGGDISGFVPPRIAEALMGRCKKP